MAFKYSNPIKTLFISVFFAPILPIGVFFGLANLFFYYWEEKYFLLKRHAIPPYFKAV
jgi:hypothetical protein